MVTTAGFNCFCGNILITIFSETTESVETKLGWNIPWMDLPTCVDPNPRWLLL